MYIVFSDRVHVPCPESVLLVVYVLYLEGQWCLPPLEGKARKPKCMKITVWC